MLQLFGILKNVWFCLYENKFYVAVIIMAKQANIFCYNYFITRLNSAFLFFHLNDMK